MLAFLNDKSIKESVLSQLEIHRLEDEIKQGSYWEDGKGCAIGCLTHDPKGGHHLYPELYGIPEELAYLEDSIFEGLSSTNSQEWPELFMSSINVGADLSNIWPQFAVWLLTDKEHGVINLVEDEKLQKAIQTISDVYGYGDINPSEVEAATRVIMEVCMTTRVVRAPTAARAAMAMARAIGEVSEVGIAARAARAARMAVRAILAEDATLTSGVSVARRAASATRMADTQGDQLIKLIKECKATKFD